MISSTSKTALSRLRAYGAKVSSTAHPETSPWYTSPLFRRAAVLVILFETRNPITKAIELSTVLTTRSNHLSSFSGQVAFPGGKADFDHESIYMAARREAMEEINFPPYNAEASTEEKQSSTITKYSNDIEHIGELPSYLARNLLVVSPSIAYVKTPEHCIQDPTQLPESYSGLPHVLGTNQELKTVLRESGEVAHVFSAPIKHFLYATEPENSRNRNSHAHPWYHGAVGNWNGLKWWLHYFNVLRRTGKQVGEPSHFLVWGLTARIIIDTARIAYEMKPEVDYNEIVGDEAVLNELVKGGYMHQPRSKADLNFPFKKIFGDRLQELRCKPSI